MSAALEEIFRLADERTRYGATINVSPDVQLLIKIRELARAGLIGEPPAEPQYDSRGCEIFDVPGCMNARRRGR